MYVSHQMLRVNHDEWLRFAEHRRLVKQAAASSQRSARAPRRLHFRRPAPRPGRQLRQA